MGHEWLSHLFNALSSCCSSRPGRVKDGRERESLPKRGKFEAMRMPAFLPFGGVFLPFKAGGRFWDGVYLNARPARIVNFLLLPPSSCPEMAGEFPRACQGAPSVLWAQWRDSTWDEQSGELDSGEHGGARQGEEIEERWKNMRGSAPCWPLSTRELFYLSRCSAVESKSHFLCFSL